MVIPFSILDLAPIVEGGTAAMLEGIRNPAIRVETNHAGRRQRGARRCKRIRIAWICNNETLKPLAVEP